LIPDSTIHAATVETGMAGDTVTAGAVIASPAVRAAAFVSEPSSFFRPKSPRLVGGSASSFITMSAFVITPSGIRARSTTGMPPMRCSASRAATSFSDTSVRTVRTSLVMRSSTFIFSSSRVLLRRAPRRARRSEPPIRDGLRRCGHPCRFHAGHAALFPGIRGT
jgi:hypothetical protein